MTNKSHDKYLIISLSPYTFIISIFLMILRKRIFVYLRSDGYEEYKCYSKFFGPLIYHLMFTIVSWRSNLIACRSHILRGKKGKIVYPSQLNQKWFLNRKSPNLNSINLINVQTEMSHPMKIISVFNLYNSCQAESSLKALGECADVISLAFLPSEEILKIGLYDLFDDFLFKKYLLK